MNERTVEQLVKREQLATLLFERLDEIENYTVARRIADLVVDRLDRPEEDR